ncbi:hypothetical protein GLA29479_1624 [Lysobacter antibioticus]|nr:hypothetical protein GLA29479_1624 [Lysobacter antibioticus]
MIARCVGRPRHCAGAGRCGLERGGGAEPRAGHLPGPAIAMAHRDLPIAVRPPCRPGRSPMHSVPRPGSGPCAHA